VHEGESVPSLVRIVLVGAVRLLVVPHPSHLLLLTIHKGKVPRRLTVADAALAVPDNTLLGVLPVIFIGIPKLWVRSIIAVKTKAIEVLCCFFCRCFNVGFVVDLAVEATSLRIRCSGILEAGEHRGHIVDALPEKLAFQRPRSRVGEGQLIEEQSVGVS